MSHQSPSAVVEELNELIRRLESNYEENRIGERDQELKNAVLYLLNRERIRLLKQEEGDNSGFFQE